MNSIFKNLKNIAILVLIAVIVLMQLFQPKMPDMKEYIKIGGKKYELLSHNIDTVEVKVHDTTIVYKPKWRIKKETEYVDIPADVDTLAILKDYYTKYSYNDTVNVDKYGTGIIKDDVTQNEIVSRQIEWDLKIPIVKETITVKELPKNQIYIGAGLGLDRVNFINNVNAGFLWKTKQDKIYGLNLGLTSPTDAVTETTKLVPYVGGSIYWKIRLKKD
jgi:hypothetical protein